MATAEVENNMVGYDVEGMLLLEMNYDEAA